MKLFLGVDGGQTTTKAVVGDEAGSLLAHATGGPSNHTEEPGGPERFEASVRSTLRQVLSAAGAPPEFRFEAACFGMTGETEIKRAILERMLHTPHLSVVYDWINALAGATCGSPGIVVIAGGGSVASGMDAEGRDVRVGGWGHIFGDEGSAYWIGRSAVRAILAEHEGTAPRTQLTSMLFQRLKAQGAYELKDKFYSGALSRGDLSSAATWVNEAAEAGDTVARDILREAGHRLADLAGRTIKRLSGQSPSGAESSGGGSNPFLVCPSGGVFKSSFVWKAFDEGIRRELSAAQVRPPLLSPVLGSLLIAYREAGCQIPREKLAAWPDRLRALSAPREGGNPETI
jgi:N-acetylglucosamine kinase-like BadF-type ATPase